MINCELGIAFNAMFTDGLTATFSEQKICDRCEQEVLEEQLSTDRLLSSAGYMRMVLEAMSDIVLLVDRDGGQIDVIPTQWTHQTDMYGIQVLNQTLERFLDPDYSPIWLAPVQTAIAQQKLVQFEYHFTVNGKMVWFTAAISPMPNQRVIWVARDITARKLAEQAIQQANARLAESIQALEHRNQKLGQLQELSDLLRACLNLQEFEQALVMQLPILFPNSTGGIFLVNDRTSPMSVLAQWGKALPNSLLVAFDNCWALKCGKPYPIIENSPCLHCTHQKLSVNHEALCIPMAAQGKAAGLFYLSSAIQPDFYQQLAAMTAEQIALALANLQLREQLKYDSIRDPLTQLFNRRYLEESLTREMHRVTRDRQPLSIILIDVDHFKRFNDTYGHKAGDYVLQAVAKELVNQVRSSDIVCRYGGEEMIIVLPNTSLEIVYRRAESIRNAVQSMQLEINGTKLAQVTVSLGIAVFPEHGRISEDLVHQADAALYRAKANGRNRTETAEDIL